MNRGHAAALAELVRPEESLNSFSYSLPKQLMIQVAQTIEEWKKSGALKSAWTGDSKVWTQSGEEKWLGWIDIPNRELKTANDLNQFGLKIRDAHFRHVILLGMGGSSLCAEVLEKSFKKLSVETGFPEFRILDSTDPTQIMDLEKSISIEDTLFIVSSKSGSTLEPNILFEYFYEVMIKVVGKSDAGMHFIAITDPGSSLETKAKNLQFRKIFYGDPSIGGRYSILSNFGMVPAALMGVDVENLLDRTTHMVRACGVMKPIDNNPGLILGAILGTLGRNAHDKVTIITSKEIVGFGAWLEQLLAESTGKNGRGLIPIDREEILSPENYGTDRVFAYLRLDTSSNTKLDSSVLALEKAGQPVIRISIPELYNLGQEFYRWEAATAVAGSVLNINPFDQPDVEASKIATQQLTSEYEASGKLPDELPIFQNGDFQIFIDSKHQIISGSKFTSESKASDLLQTLIKCISPGDYFAILAYVPMNPANDEILQDIRSKILKAKRVATCVEFGPRFLHSTGQVYKGGPNSGVFLQITVNDSFDLTIPGHRYTFGVVKSAEARGDFSVLASRNRRAMRIHLREDSVSGLKALRREIDRAVI